MFKGLHKDLQISLTFDFDAEQKYSNIIKNEINEANKTVQPPLNLGVPHLICIFIC